MSTAAAWRLTERVELDRAAQELADAMEEARACGYRPGSLQMQTLERAEDRLQRARQRWQALLNASTTRPATPTRDVVIDLRDQKIS